MRSVVAHLKKMRRLRKVELPADFVEADYLAVNPDVAHAIRKGLARSGADHWRRAGAHEGRRLSAGDGIALPPDFDEEAYLQANPDVRIAIQDGVFPNGASHWLAVGHRDERRYKRSNPGTGPAQAESEWEALLAAGRADAFPGWRAAGDVADGGFDAPAYARSNPDVAKRVGETADSLLTHWRERGFLEGRTPYGHRPYRDRRFGPRYWQREDSVGFFGFLEAQTGLGESARGYLKALHGVGVPVHAHTVIDLGARFQTPDWQPPTRGSRGSKVNLFHLNADMTHRFFLDGRRALLDDTFNIAIWFWELSDLRRDLVSAFGAFDEIWVASEFVRRSIASLSPIPVVKVPMVVTEPAVPDRLPRSYFGIPDDAFVFACIFDVGSVTARKNPGGAIRAFKAAFGDRGDVLLLLKYHGSHHYPETLAELHALAGSSANIRFYERDFSDAEIHAFTAAIDCLVSPHRSEGFGLNLAEAMIASKPVIATGFSGNMEFMTAANSYLVDFELRELGRDHGPYPACSLWAEPSIDDLAAHMRSVFDDRAAAAAKAEVARADILAKHAVDGVSRAIRDRFDALQLFAPLPRFVETWGRGLDARTEFHNAAGPCVTVLVPADGIEGARLHRCVRSVLHQTYALWELIVFGGDPSDPDTLTYTSELRGSDHRIKLSLGGGSRSRAAACNDAVALSSGTFVVLLDRCEELDPSALSEIAAASLRHPGVDLIRSDGDQVPILRRAFLLRIGGFTDSAADAPDAGFAERASREAGEIAHVPAVLRTTAGSEATAGPGGRGDAR